MNFINVLSAPKHLLIEHLSCLTSTEDTGKMATSDELKISYARYIRIKEKEDNIKQAWGRQCETPTFT